jgi:branched-chain amino acid transport system substrate-binding protein
MTRSKVFGGFTTVFLIGSLVMGNSSFASTTDNAPLKIGVITSLTGTSGLYGGPVKATVELAVKELNAAGGANGKKIQVVFADDASSPAGAAKAARKLFSQDKVNALIAMTNSANRDAFLGLVKANRIPMIYTTLYEGGVCLPNFFVIGEVPQQYVPAYTYLVKSQGAKKTFLIGHDYIWPQKILPLADKAITAAGGSVTGTELVPFGTTDFGPIIQKIKDSGSDSILVALVGGDFGTFVKQWRQAGLDKTTKMTTLGMTDDYAQALGASADGIQSIFGYFNGVKTAANTAMIAQYEAANPKAFYQNTLTEATYDGVLAFAKAANISKSTGSSALTKALAGISIPNSPRGPLTIDAKTHHVTSTMYLVVADSAGKFSQVSSFAKVPAGPQCSF